MGLVQGVLGLAGPWARARLGHVRVPIAPVGRAVVDLEEVGGVHWEARDDARGAVAAEQALVQAVSGLVSGGEALLDRVVGDDGEDPRAHFLSVVLRAEGGRERGREWSG